MSDVEQRGGGSEARGLGRWWKWVRRHPAAVVGGVIVAAFVVIAVFAPLLAPFGQNQQVGPPFGSPTAAHPLGLDDVGHDVVSLMIWGARISMFVGVVAAAISVAIGGAVGLFAGYSRGWADTALVGVTDYFLVMPVLPLAIVIATLWGPSLRNEIIIIGLLSWPQTMRVVRAQVKTVRERVFVARARSLGASDARILFRHVMPQVTPLLVASTVLSIGNAIFFEAALSFLGLGDPTQVSWGTMIANAFDRGAVTLGAWWAIVPPGVAIALVVLGTSMLGRAFEDAFNPRLAVSHLSVRSFQRRMVDRESLHSDV